MIVIAHCDYAVTPEGIRCCPCCGTTRYQGLCDLCDLERHLPDECGCTPCSRCEDHPWSSDPDWIEDLPF